MVRGWQSLVKCAGFRSLSLSGSEGSNRKSVKFPSPASKKMQIKDLVPKQKSVEIELEITELGLVREFMKFGQPGRVLSATAKDKTGSIILTLWNDQIELVKIGDKVKITDGYVNEWQGETQMTTVRNGVLEVLKSGKK